MIQIFSYISNTKNLKYSFSDGEDLSNFQIESKKFAQANNFKSNAASTLINLPSANRILTLRQLKDFIEEIYESKVLKTQHQKT